MRVATVDGLVTLFYDGTKILFNPELSYEWKMACYYHDDLSLINGSYKDYEDWEDWDLSAECKEYTRERLSWQQVIVVDGVTEILEYTFYKCKNITRVIFADTVIRINPCAFIGFKSLAFIKLPINLEYIGEYAFVECNLSSVFIPPRCREIGDNAFYGNKNLTILNVPRQNTELGQYVIGSTKLQEKCPFDYPYNYAWLQEINNEEKFALHRVCSSFEPTLQMILDVLKEKGGPKAFNAENSIGITPSRYLKENPYAHVNEKEVIEKYILQMMGEL